VDAVVVMCGEFVLAAKLGEPVLPTEAAHQPSMGIAGLAVARR